MEEGRLTNGERNLYKNEEEFDPERRAKDAMLSIVDAEALKLGADEDGRDEISDTGIATSKSALRTFTVYARPSLRVAKRYCDSKQDTHMNKTRNLSCSFGCLNVSKMDKRIIPAPPAIDAIMAMIDRASCV